MDEFCGEEQGIQLVLFKLEVETYGVNIATVREIILTQHYTHFPEARSFVEGLINLRGKIIPVIDLKKLFDLKQKAKTDQNRIMVMDVKGVSFGMIVDEVLEVVYISREMIEPPPPAFNGIDGGFIDGIANKGGEIIVVLNTVKILEANIQ